MKKLFLFALTMALFVACNSDDDSTATITTNAGTLDGGPFTFLVDGVPDMVSGITTDPNAQGTNRTFIITDAYNNILGIPPTNEALEAVDFDGAGVGACLIWYARFEDGLTGLEMGQNLDGLSGNFDISNSILVTRNAGPEAGVLSGGPFTFCVDGTSDMVSGITTDPNATGSLRTFVITDDLGNILGLPPTTEALEGVDFDGAGAGVCLIWYLRYEDGLTGLETGFNVDNLNGDFDFSNSISVTRNETNGGTAIGGPFTFTVDGNPDMVSGIALDGSQTGSNGTWIITDGNTGSILGLPPTIEALENVDFDGAGVGVCFIYYIRYEDGLQGLMPMENLADLDGCFSLSNSISVTRN